MAARQDEPDDRLGPLYYDPNVLPPQCAVCRLDVTPVEDAYWTERYKGMGRGSLIHNRCKPHPKITEEKT